VELGLAHSPVLRALSHRAFRGKGAIFHRLISRGLAMLPSARLEAYFGARKAA